MGVGDGRLCPLSITDWSGIGPGGLRPGAQRSSVVKPSDGTAPRTDRVNVEHGNGHRQTAHEPFLAGGERAALLNVVEQCDVGRGAAHVEGDDPFTARQFGHIARAHHAAGGPGKHRADRLLGSEAGGNGAPVGLHDLNFDFLFARHLFYLAQVAAHYRHQKGVDRHGGGALVLAELGQDFMRDTDGQTERLQRAGDLPLVGRVDKRKQQRNSYSFRTYPAKLSNHLFDGLRVQGRQHFPARAHSFRYTQPPPRGNQRRGTGEGKIVKLFAGLASDGQHILKPFGCDQRHPRSVSSEHGVGADGGAVQQLKGGCRASLATTNLLEGINDGARRIGGSRKYFQNFQTSVAHKYAVGKGPAGINSNSHEFGVSFPAGTPAKTDRGQCSHCPSAPPAPSHISESERIRRAGPPATRPAP